MIYVLLALGLVYMVLLLITLRHILFYVHEPARALSWILFVLFIPILGLLLFRLIGRNVKQDRLFQRHRQHQQNQEDIETSALSKTQRRLVELLHKNESAFISYNNEVRIIKTGPLAFESIIKDFKEAQHYIFLDFYIVEDGKILNQFTEIFKDKIVNGIEIHMVYDGFGTRKNGEAIIESLKSIGVKVYEFMPFKWLSMFSYLNYRNHRKLICIDGHLAYTGGMNISDNYIEEDKDLGIWKDTIIRVNGPATYDFERVFYRDYLNAGGKVEQLSPRYTDQDKGSVPIQVVSSGPDSEFRSIMQAYFVLITDAEDYVYISSPYFIPGESILTALKTSALSGVDVRLMLPDKSDSKWLRWCMFTYLEELLKAGVKVYLYQGGFLHSKVIVSDDRVSSVGTANMDVRSFETNFEINAMIYDSKTATILKDRFIEDVRSCMVLDLKSFSTLSGRNKLMESVARLSSPML